MFLIPDDTAEVPFLQRCSSYSLPFITVDKDQGYNLLSSFNIAIYRRVAAMA